MERDQEYSVEMESREPITEDWQFSSKPTERERFEDWCLVKGYCTDKRDDGDYYVTAVNRYWAVWMGSVEHRLGAR